MPLHTFTTQGGQRSPPVNLRKSPNTPRQVQHELPLTADSRHPYSCTHTQHQPEQLSIWGDNPCNKHIHNIHTRRVTGNETQSSP